MPFRKNFQFSIFNFQFSDGFTLIELLVVLGILVTAVGATLLFLTNVLKGTNQANVTAEVKQNGQAVLDLLEKQIRGATAAVEITPNGSSSGVNITKTDGNSLYIACFNSIASPSSNGWIGVADVSPGTDINTGDYESITSRDTISGVDITCTPPLGFKIIPTASGSPPIVSISFMVQGIDAPSRADFLANVKFETTISLRQY
ncbi:MAG: hypothetical protein UT95_C0005G0018 [Candidatus Curtissbacteria bacterium GW2011_GWB1_40_28]|nr:MAG: hypothetical protein UT95_C0005G0018 [Candidatus Curtissbacteria bacterium GW2011_GWB1_40_28]